MTKYKVIKDRTVDIVQPIKLEKNQVVECIEESDPNGEWPNWIYCRIEKQTGWVPKQIITQYHQQNVISEAYDATEISIKIGEIIIGEYQLNNWVWGHLENSQDKGWFPINHLERL